MNDKLAAILEQVVLSYQFRPNLYVAMTVVRDIKDLLILRITTPGERAFYFFLLKLTENFLRVAITRERWVRG